jgi:guanine nucleotide-binding protein subunit alpha
LLGSGESGKSTILKQMKIIHQNGYSQEDLLMYKTTIYKNLLDCAKSIVSALEQFGYTFEENEETAQPALPDSTDTTAETSENLNTAVPTTEVMAATRDSKITSADLEFIKASIISPDPDTFFDPKLAAIISKLWADPIVKKIFTEQRAQFYIMDSAPYFFSNVDRISDPDYIPNVADILRARIKTTGIYETRFEMGKLNIHMFDVGGQRSERRKWINCFDNVTLIIFCVALSEYDQVLLEESSQNRMAESLVLFDSIINSRWFARTSVVLFLNKIDVFTEKLAYSPLKDYFPDYTGGDDIKNAAKYILWRFNKLNRNQVTIYPHLTQATDTSNIRVVFAAVKETILQNSLRDSGIL